MKKLTFWMVALAASLATALEAQDITGNWQGTLQPGQQKVRLVFRIAAENDKLTATIRTADQPSPPIATTITRDGSSIKITIPAIKGKYEGKLSADGNSITGTFSQGAQLPLEPGTRHPRDCLVDSRTSASAETNGTGCKSGIRSGND
jgi:hypothetical protein